MMPNSNFEYKSSLYNMYHKEDLHHETLVFLMDCPNGLGGGRRGRFLVHDEVFSASSKSRKTAAQKSGARSMADDFVCNFASYLHNY